MTLSDEIRNTAAMIQPIRADTVSEWWRDADGGLHLLCDEDDPDVIMELPPLDPDALKRVEETARSAAQITLDEESDEVRADSLRFVWRTGETCHACEEHHDD